MTARRDPRLTSGLRAAVSIAVPVLAGWYFGDVGAGLIASLGSFVSRFGGERPYLNRAVTLALVAVSLAVSVALGDWAAQLPWAGVLMVSAVAVAAVWLCNSLAVGPPGAYVFVVACAAGVGISSGHIAPWISGLLVLSGGAFAWLVQMSGIVSGLRRPERAAVAAAGEAVSAYIQAAPAQVRAARNRAATALHNSWRVLIDYQPRRVGPTSVLHELRGANRALHALFTKAVEADTAEQARQIGRLELPPEAVVTRDLSRTPLTRPPFWISLIHGASRGSHVRHVMQRIAIAVPVAGSAALLLGLGHPYWAMAAAVLVLHQGTDRGRTLRRGGELLLGTWAGLGFAGLILLMHPSGLWLAPLLAVLSFGIAVLAPRNYALAAVFITATSLTIASGTHAVDIGWLLLSRGTDVLIGCTVGLAVYLVAVRFQEATRLSDAIASTLEATAAVLPYIAVGDTAALPARSARRDVQIAAMTMMEAEEAAQAGSLRQRSVAEPLWPTVLATEQLAYRAIAACWTIEHRSDGREFGLSLFGGQPAQSGAEQLKALAAAVRTGEPVPTAADTPPFVAAEVAALRESLLF